MSEDMKGLYIRWLLELWNGDFTVAQEIVAPGFVGHWPGGREVRGPDGLVDIVTETRGYFTELGFTLEVGPIAEGDMVAARWTGRGTMQDGANVSMSGHDLLRVEASKVVEYWGQSEPPN